MAYATPEQLAEAPYQLSPPNAALLLDRASRDVDSALLCARYDPTDPDVVAALRLATLEQVAAGIANGDKDGLGASRPPAFTLGRLAMQGAPVTPPEGAAVKVGRLWESAWLVLQQAGLTGQGPSEPGWWCNGR